MCVVLIWMKPEKKINIHIKRLSDILGTVVAQMQEVRGLTV